MLRVFLISSLVVTITFMLSLFSRFSNTPVASASGYLGYNHSIESLTRDVYVKPLHSHNDYWRHQPLFDALLVGAKLVEADIFCFEIGYEVERVVIDGTSGERRIETSKFKDDEIYVGHNQVFLDPQNTLDNLYLNPIFDFLRFSNPNFSREAELVEPRKWHGIYWNQPEESLLLWFDFKTNAEITYKRIKSYLQRFIDHDFLSYYDVEKNQFVEGPITLTITGNLPETLVENEKKRYFFLDAPLSKLDEKWSSLSRVASGSLELIIGKTSKLNRLPFSDTDKSKLDQAFARAHALGLKTRVWGDVTWPDLVLYSHLGDYYKLGGDLLNADNLTVAASIL